MVTPRQIRAGRALLGWTQQLLADRALVAVNSVRAVERGLSYPKSETVESMRAAMNKAGIVFLSEGVMGEGVRLAKPAVRRRESKS
jgi:transcriptional regulator with XRE-family HTH domain